MSEPNETGKATTPQAMSDTDSKPAVRSSKLDVKDISEVCVILVPQHRSRELIAYIWDSVAYAYKIVEPPVVTEVEELEPYAFVIRTRAGKYSGSTGQPKSDTRPVKAETRSIVTSTLNHRVCEIS